MGLPITCHTPVTLQLKLHESLLRVTSHSDSTATGRTINREHSDRETNMFPPGFEPGTFRVLGRRDNHYTTETDTEVLQRTATRQVCNKRLQAQLRLMPQRSDDRGAANRLPAARAYAGNSGTRDFGNVANFCIQV